MARLLALVGPGLFQHGIVVEDIAAARTALGSVLGCTAWAELPATDLAYDLRGRTVTCALELAFARSGGLQVELLRPEIGRAHV